MVAMPRRIAASVRFPKPRTSCGGGVGGGERERGLGGTRDGPLGRGAGDGVLVDGRRQAEDGVEPGGEAGDLDIWHVVRQRGEQRLAFAPVAGTHSPKMTVVAPGLDQPAERELIQPG